MFGLHLPHFDGQRFGGLVVHAQLGLHAKRNHLRGTVGERRNLHLHRVENFGLDEECRQLSLLQIRIEFLFERLEVSERLFGSIQGWRPLADRRDIGLQLTVTLVVEVQVMSEQPAAAINRFPLNIVQPAVARADDRLDRQGLQVEQAERPMIGGSAENDGSVVLERRRRHELCKPLD